MSELFKVSVRAVEPPRISLELLVCHPDASISTSSLFGLKLLRERSWNDPALEALLPERLFSGSEDDKLRPIARKAISSITVPSVVGFVEDADDTPVVRYDIEVKDKALLALFKRGQRWDAATGVDSKDGPFIPRGPRAVIQKSAGKVGTFPARIPLRGGVLAGAIARDGSTIVLLDERNGSITVAERGKKVRSIWLATRSELAPDRGDHRSDPIRALRMIEHQGRPAILACWDDDMGDGPGIGVFDVASGAAIAVTWFLDRATRKRRIHATTTNGVNLGISQLEVSDDGQYVLARRTTGIEVWTTASVAAGKPTGKRFKGGGEVGFMRGNRIAIWDKHSLSLMDAATGKVTRVKIDRKATSGDRYIGGAIVICNSMDVFSIVDDTGAVKRTAPGEGLGCTRAGAWALASATVRSKLHAVAIDLERMNVVGTRAIAGATKIIDARANDVILAAGKRCALVVPWPFRKAR